MTDQHKLDFEQRQLAEVLANEIVDCADTINYAYELIWLRQQVKDANKGAERNAIINRELAQELAALKQAQGEPVAWYNPANKAPEQSVTFSQESHNKWTHLYPVALYTSAPTIPVGYVLVPVEPTLEMQIAWQSKKKLHLG